jgi:NAD(P) transhydrogenase subunit beta
MNDRLLWLSMAVGAAGGSLLAAKVAMIQMPQLVALLNGLGGGASAIVGLVVLSNDCGTIDVITRSAGAVALSIGGITVGGSAIAAGKLDQRIRQRPIVLKGHTAYAICTLALAILGVAGAVAASPETIAHVSVCALLVALCFGVLFTIRVGGADMPIAISLLNSLSGVAASIAGLAIRNPLLVVVGAIVGTAGLVLTQIMCRAMNRSLLQVLMGRTTIASPEPRAPTRREEHAPPEDETATEAADARTEHGGSIASILQQAHRVVIVPGYGMALAQAQLQVRELIDRLEADGKEVRVAIHPVAGRMPGHMNVLLAEAGVPYEKLCEMDDINPELKTTDLVVVVGANDVVNPAAATAEGTPIYGMPILRVSEAKHVIVCNKDTQPGYAGVDNPLYGYANVTLLLGDAAETVAKLVERLDEATSG